MQAHFVHPMALGPWQNFVYFVGCSDSGRTAVVDPAWECGRILAEARERGLTITDIICTHSHSDHINRVEELVESTDARVHMLAPEVDFSGLAWPNLMAHAPGAALQVGRVEIGLLHTPGHTPGSLTLRLPDSILTGDTMFVNGCGRCDFVGGDPEVMYRTLWGLMRSLPAETRLYPGHDYGPTPQSTLGDQLRDNPFLLQPTLEDFVRHRMTGKTRGAPAPPKPEWPARG
jgi:hydroxyacylglutathione hydrolase